MQKRKGQETDFSLCSNGFKFTDHVLLFAPTLKIAAFRVRQSKSRYKYTVRYNYTVNRKYVKDGDNNNLYPARISGKHIQLPKQGYRTKSVVP